MGYKDAIITALYFGLKDSLNPYVLSAGLLLGLYLLTRRCPVGKGIDSALVFVIAAFLGSFLMFNGLFDSWVYRNEVARFIEIANFCLAISYTVISIYFLHDWYCDKSDKKDTVIGERLLLLLGDTQKASESERGPARFSVFVIPLVLGAGAAILTSIWPQHYFVDVMYYYKFLGHAGVTQIFFSIYSFAHWFFLIALLGGLMLVYKNLGIREKVRKHLSTLKIALGAMYMSVGLGMIYCYFNF